VRKRKGGKDSSDDTATGKKTNQQNKKRRGKIEARENERTANLVQIDATFSK